MSIEEALVPEAILYHALGHTDSIQAYINDFKASFTSYPAGFYESFMKTIFILATVEIDGSYTIPV